ncbi:MAG: hypothetical protein AAFP77_02650 [Bacteroidota bacterium]
MKKSREYLFIGWFFIGFPVWYFGVQVFVDEDIKEILSNTTILFYVLFVVLSAVLYFAFTHYSFRYQTIGELLIEENYLTIVINETEEVWQLDQLKMVEIIRNTAHHRYEDDDHGEAIFPGNNFLQLTDKNGQTNRYEFLIEDKSHDEEFQRMINHLQFNRRRDRRFLSV